MDEVARTSEIYEADADAFVEKYRRESIADRFWDDVDPVFPGERLLDVGCGPGPDTETFQSRGYEVVGVDLTPSFLVEARDHVDAPFVRGDMRSLPFASDCFDGVWASASLLHVPREDVPGTLREFRRVLDAPGAVIATLKHVDDPQRSGEDRHFERYTADDARDLATEAGFGDVTVERNTERWLRLVARVQE